MLNDPEVFEIQDSRSLNVTHTGCAVKLCPAECAKEQYNTNNMNWRDQNIRISTIFTAKGAARMRDRSVFGPGPHPPTCEQAAAEGRRGPWRTCRGIPGRRRPGSMRPGGQSRWRLPGSSCSSPGLRRWSAPGSRTPV